MLKIGCFRGGRVFCTGQGVYLSDFRPIYFAGSGVAVVRRPWFFADDWRSERLPAGSVAGSFLF